LLDVLRKRIDHGTLVVMIVCPEEPAINERVDLGAVKLNSETPIAGPTSCAATPHSLCSSTPCGFGFDGLNVRQLPDHANQCFQ
jgi:hypothetical protein